MKSAGTTRRVVRELKDVYRLSSLPRVHRPWLTQPGLWVQYDFGDGPVIDGEKTILFVAWVAWSRFRVVFPLRNRKMTTVVIARHAGIPEFHPVMEKSCAYYGTSIQVCQPADPASKGGVESSVKLAKEDILPRNTNLRGEYDTFGRLETACREFMVKVNQRPHRLTGVPLQQLLEETESSKLGPLSVDAPYTLFGEVRKVSENMPMISVYNVMYSVPEESASAVGMVSDAVNPNPLNAADSVGRGNGQR